MTARIAVSRPTKITVAVAALALSLAGYFGGSPTAESSTAPQVSSGPVEMRYMTG